MAGYYVDSAAAGGGDGSEGSPFNALSSLNWTTIASDISGGGTATIYLKRGSVFRETLTVGTSGVSARRLTIRDYSTGNKPVIAGSNIVSTWTAYESGAAWRCK